MANDTPPPKGDMGESVTSKPRMRHGLKVYAQQLSSDKDKYEWVSGMVGHLRNRVEDELTRQKGGMQELTLGEALLVQSACRHEEKAQLNHWYIAGCKDPSEKLEWMHKCEAAAAAATKDRDDCLRQLGVLPAAKSVGGVDPIAAAKAAMAKEDE